MNASPPGVRALPSRNDRAFAAGEGTGGEKTSFAARPCSADAIFFQTVIASTNFFCCWALWFWRRSLAWWVD
jgi:hypothetical protein